MTALARSDDSHKRAFINIVKRRQPKRYLEWGSGLYSTKWATENINYTISIEHDPVWAQKVRSMYGPEHEVRLCQDTENPVGDYVSPKNLEEASFDLILIDGRNRKHCNRSARRLIKPDGVVIIHDTERECEYNCAMVWPYINMAYHSNDQTIMVWFDSTVVI